MTRKKAEANSKLCTCKPTSAAQYKEIVSETANGEIRIPVKMNLGLMSKLTGKGQTLDNVYVTVWKLEIQMISVFTRFIDALLEDDTITVKGDTDVHELTGEVIAYNLTPLQVQGLAGYLREHIRSFNPAGYNALEQRFEEWWGNLEKAAEQRLGSDDEEDEEDEEDTPDPN